MVKESLKKSTDISDKVSSVVVGQSIRNWVRRQPETDADTRDNRKDRKATVDVQPASTAIINVYELVDKRMFGRTQKGAKAEKLFVSPVSGKRGTEDIKTEVRKSKIFPERGVNKFGNLIGLREESEKQYLVNNRLHRDGERKLKEDEISSVNTKQQEKDLEMMEEAKKFDLKAAKRGSLKSELLKRINKERITYDNTVQRWDGDGRYYRKSIGEPEDILHINKAIDKAIEERRMSESPPAIIAVGDKYNSPYSTQSVYIKKDLISQRKKKSSHTKIKRSMKHPVVHGNKRRVVMKKKGGRK